MAYFIIGLIVVGGIVFYFTSCKNKQNSKQTDDYVSKSRDTVKVHTLPDNNFLDLRNMALNVTPEQLQLSFPVDQTKVFGVVMDWNLGDGTMTDHHTPNAVVDLCFSDLSSGETTLISFVVFPNPSADGKFQFQTSNASEGVQTIEIYNILGERIFLVSDLNLNSRIIDISNQPSGVYILTVVSGENKFHQQLIKH